MNSTFSRFSTYSAGSSVPEATLLDDNRRSLSAEDTTSSSQIPHGRHKKSIPRKVLRRLRGFLVEIEDSVATVCFIEKEEQYEYSFPAELLKEAGIKMTHQPFEMDEFEERGEGGSYAIGYLFKPMAEANTRFIEPLEFDEVRQQKLRFIQSKLKNASP